MICYWRQVAETYDAVAKLYDGWAWQKFWRLNEWPIIEDIFASTGLVQRSLDVGVGTGAYWDLHTTYSNEVIGVDVSVGMLDILLQQHRDAAIVCANASLMPFHGEVFDRLLATRVLTHHPSVGPFMSEAWRVLRPGGVLIVSDIDPEHEYEAIRFPKVDGVSNRMVLAPQKHSISSIITAANRVGFNAGKSSRVCYRDLAWQPQNGELSSVRPRSSKNIFYVCVLNKPFLR